MGAIAKFVLFTIENLPVMEKILSKLTFHELSGSWCCCWEFDPEQEAFQVGTMEIKHIKKNIKVKIYSAGALWKLEGNFQDNLLIATYGEKRKINLEFANDGKNRDILKGNWSGPVKLQHSTTKEPVFKHFENLNFFASRGQFINYSCHVREFRSGEGLCTA
jgi:hypothetical protein